MEGQLKRMLGGLVF